VQSIVRELGGERIDIVPWSQDPTVFVSRALSPARVMDVRVHEPEKRMVVVVADDQLSLAIGKGGQNARLAARLTGWKIDLISKSEEKKRQDLERASRVEVEKLELGEATTEKLISAGIETVQELIATPLEKLVEIPGIGEKTAEKILSTAHEYLAAHPPVEPEATPAVELEFTPEDGASPPEAAGATASGAAPPETTGTASSAEAGAAAESADAAEADGTAASGIAGAVRTTNDGEPQ
jgi:N utilization substance protein A